AASPRRWSTRRRRPRLKPRRSARYAAHGRTPRSPSLLPFLQVLADDIEEALPALPLAFYPIRGLGERLRPQGEAVSPAVDHAAHEARLLQRLQVPRDSRLGDAKVAGHLADRRHPAAEPFHDVAPQRMREGFKRIVSHSANYIPDHADPTGGGMLTTEHRIGTQAEWKAERDQLLKEEKELTRRGDELARKRRELPWVPV